MREIIRQSWERSEKYNISKEKVHIPSVSEEELERRVNSSKHVVDILNQYVDPLIEVLKGNKYTMGFLDKDGVAVKIYNQVEKFSNDLSLGKIWREHYVGTTAVGLAMRTKKVVVVDKDEHYCDYFKSVVAVGQPITVYGEFLGVLVLAMDFTEGLDYIVNLMSLLIKRVEEQLTLQEVFWNNTIEGKSFEEIFRTFIHEIKNPLSNIRAFLQLQQLKNNNQAQYDKMIVEVDRISEMIDNFRYMTIQREDLESKINIKELIKNIYDGLIYIFDLKGCQLELDLLSECYVLGNENKLKQVFLNIIKNALEAVKSDEGKVIIRLDCYDNKSKIEIIDNGQGISLEELDLIFQPFYTTKTKGDGLGLSVCQEIISHHHGEIKFDSEVGEGTTVTITMPLANF